MTQYLLIHSSYVAAVDMLKVFKGGSSVRHPKPKRKPTTPNEIKTDGSDSKRTIRKAPTSSSVAAVKSNVLLAHAF